MKPPCETAAVPICGATPGKGIWSFKRFGQSLQRTKTGLRRNLPRRLGAGLNCSRFLSVPASRENVPLANQGRRAGRGNLMGVGIGAWISGMICSGCAMKQRPLSWPVRQKPPCASWFELSQILSEDEQGLVGQSSEADLACCPMSHLMNCRTYPGRMCRGLQTWRLT